MLFRQSSADDPNEVVFETHLEVRRLPCPTRGCWTLHHCPGMHDYPFELHHGRSSVAAFCEPKSC